MKKIITPILDVAALLAIPLCLFILFGCATGANRAPTAFEQKFFNIQTNYVPQVMVTTVTNYQIEKVRQVVVETNTVTITNQQSGAQEQKIVYVPVTNTLVKEVPVVTKEFITNTVPSYTYTPNATTAQIKAGAETVGGLFGPYGGMAAAAVGGIFGLWGHLRSSKANATSAVLTQVIETGSELLKTTPQGTVLADKWRTWMIAHQAEQGVIENVTKIVANVVDNEAAKDAAAKLTALTASVRGA